MSTIKDDKCAGIILDFIAGGVPDNPSGEAHGNYNAYFGHALSTVDLSMHTLSGIYGFQDTMLAQDRRSTAVGRYQFLRKTLQGLQAECNLPDTDLFTPDLQDKLGLRLLKRRGYAEWKSGTINDAEFAHRLSMEWASLPDPDKGGRSHYDGDSAGNHASTTLDAVYKMLKQARSTTGGGTQQSPAPSPDPMPTPSHAFNHDYLIVLQAFMAASGDYTGDIDGIDGPLTQAAVAAITKRTQP